MAKNFPRAYPPDLRHRILELVRPIRIKAIPGG
jgi:hypothetical protein